MAKQQRKSILLLLMDVTDLSADGFKIVRLSDISRVECHAPEKWFEKILREEEIVKTVQAPFTIDLSTWKSVITSIKRHARTIMIEDENPDDDLYIIGKVKRVESQTVSIHHIDAGGYWEQGVRVIPYSRITAVTFGDRYSRLCSKYVRHPS
jgi:hypothetical protein